MVVGDDELETDASEDLEDADADDIEEEEAALQSDDDEEDGDDASLEELLAQRASARRAPDDSDDDNDDIMALSSEKDTATATALPSKVLPIKDQQEFVCRSCYLVKARSQLADATRMYCRDCA